MGYGHPEEEQLLEKIIAGYARAFREIYDFYQARIRDFAFRLTKSRDDAEEMTQEIFIRVWEKRSLIRPGMPFGPYIKTVAQNHIYNFFRKVARDRRLLQKVQAGMDALRHTDPQQLLAKELQRLYEEAIDRLPPQKKIIYRLSRKEDLSYEEIAVKLGISRHTVRNHLAEAVKSIRAYVAAHTDIACLILAICLKDR